MKDEGIGRQGNGKGRLAVENGDGMSRDWGSLRGWLAASRDS